MKSLILFFLSMVMVLSGCLYQRPYIINQPPGPVNTTVFPGQLSGPVSPPQVAVWRPDPTVGLIQNSSRNIFLRLWIDSRPPSPPTLELGPEQAIPINLFLGSHNLYAEGMIFLAPYNRWVSIGTARQAINIRNYSHCSGYCWEVYVGDADFDSFGGAWQNFNAIGFGRWR